MKTVCTSSPATHVVRVVLSRPSRPVSVDRSAAESVRVKDLDWILVVIPFLVFCSFLVPFFPSLLSPIFLNCYDDDLGKVLMV